MIFLWFCILLFSPLSRTFLLLHPQLGDRLEALHVVALHLGELVAHELVELREGQAGAVLRVDGLGGTNREALQLRGGQLAEELPRCLSADRAVQVLEACDLLGLSHEKSVRADTHGADGGTEHWIKS